MKLILFWVWAALKMTSCVATSLPPLRDESWNLDRHYRRAHTDVAMVTEGHVDGPSSVRTISWTNDAKCHGPAPTKTANDSTDDLLPQSSTCPWNWVINFDHRRSPALLLEARCACRRCHSGGHGDRCRPVHYFRPVTYYKGEEREVSRLYRLAVGCTCERRSVRQ